MATIDELLNSEEEQYTRIGKYILSADYEDDEGPVEVNGRVIGDLSNEISVQGENNSQYITFIIPRFYDGIDLLEMSINIHYENASGDGSNDFPVNAYYSDEHIKFGWIIPQEALLYEGTISICIFAFGIKNNKQYLFKTETKKYNVKSGLDVRTGTIEPDENWYLNFVLRLEQTTDELIEEAKGIIDEYASQYFEIDSELDEESSHAVKNSVITQAINSKQDKAIVQDRMLVL